jgi:hypothetical protein
MLKRNETDCVRLSNERRVVSNLSVWQADGEDVGAFVFQQYVPKPIAGFF